MRGTLQHFDEELRGKYSYDPMSGEVRRLVRAGNFPAGSVCTSQTTNKKYLKTGLKGIMPVRGGTLFRAEVCINGVRHQKHSKSIETLQQWVINKRNELHQTFARN